MSQLTQGARSPTSVDFIVSTGAVVGTTVTRIVVRVLRPTSGEVVTAFDGAPTSSTASQVVARWVFASDGSSLPESGDHRWVATLYASATRLGDTNESTLPVAPRRVPLP